MRTPWMAGSIVMFGLTALIGSAEGRGPVGPPGQSAAASRPGSGPTAFDPEKMFPPEALKEDLRILWDLLEEGHGGLDRYAPASELEKIFAGILSRLTEPLTEYEFFLRLLPLMTAIGDGHTALRLSPGAAAFLEARPVFFPFGLRVLDDKTYLFRNLSSETTIETGSELLAIDGKPMAEILYELLPLIPADAGIRTHRLRKLEFPATFGRLLSLRYGRREFFRLHFCRPWSRNIEEVSVPGIRGSDIGGILEARFPDAVRGRPFYELSFLGTAALLTIRNFGDDPEPGRPPFPDFLEKTFRALEMKKTPYLIIDLRGNGGGRDEYGKFLFAHFMDRPFSYYRALEAKKNRYDLFKFTNETAEDIEDLARFVQKNDRGGYDLLGHPNSGLQNPRPPRFAGRAAILMDGLSFSTSGEVASLFHFHRKAVFFGEECGSGYYGNTAGFIVWATLPATGLQARIPLIRTVLEVDGYTRHRGLTPDFHVSPTIEDLLAGRDPAMEKALRFLQRK